MKTFITTSIIITILTLLNTDKGLLEALHISALIIFFTSPLVLLIMLNQSYNEIHDLRHNKK
jgi:hypothetical protein